MSDERKLTGKHAAAIFIGAFGVIITVNLAMAWNAVSTFPGLTEKNPYIASQSFDDRRAAQEALGWQAEATFDEGYLVLSLRGPAGEPVRPAALEAVVGRPTHKRADFAAALDFNGRDYVAPADLGEGYWTVRVEAEAADGTPFEKRLQLSVRG
ncbi:nitrogen fixation protein FixH [Rhodosalinus sediminis]|uniref:Nitrogen fixation protein FixH n=1 Tax=Rhodosalinus sediminis TaxID=1940533 RepID=A0A3D9BXY5_9RHOB|nr:FixH family protein [Rhodosalinus sediminis]REC58246.1 nitrogen fixation protein FixH [Rhodosalinus sediminis]